MGYWNCNYCNTKNIAGNIRDCPNCGQPRGTDTKFHINMSGPQTHINNSEAESIRKRGADWICPYCNSLNSNETSECISCGSNKSESTHNYFTQHENENNRSYDNHETTRVIAANSQQNHKFQYNIKPIILCIAIIFAVIAVISLAVNIFTPKEIQFRINSFQWSRSIDIEHYITVNESDWYVPSGGRIQYTRSEIHHYESTIDHYEQRTRDVIDYYEEVVVGYQDLGNGYFEEITEQRPVYKTEYYDEPIYKDVPVYDTKYYYEIERWRHSRTINTSGYDHNAYWGKLDLADNEREANRSSEYKITGIIVSKDETKTFTVSESDWNEMQEDNTYTLIVTINNHAQIKKDDATN